MARSIVLLVLLLGAAVAQAQVVHETTDPWDTEPRTSWTLSFEPRIWYAGPSGDLRFPGGTGASDKIDLSDLNSDDPRVNPFGELRFQRGRWRLELAGMWFDATNSATLDAPMSLGEIEVFAGERARLDFTHATFEARALYRFARYVDGSTEDGRDIVQFSLFAGGGLRLTSIDLELQVTPTDMSRTGSEITSSSYNHIYAEPMVAAALELRVRERFSMSLEGTAGYFTSGNVSSSSFSIQPTFGWYPVENLGIEIGYRMLIHFMEDGKNSSRFEWEGSMAGLFGGISLRF